MDRDAVLTVGRPAGRRGGSPTIDSGGASTHRPTRDCDAVYEYRCAVDVAAGGPTLADQRDPTTCPLCGSPAWRRRSPGGEESFAPRPDRVAPDPEHRGAHGSAPPSDAGTIERRATALEQAVRRLRSALIGVAERQGEGDSLPCYCVGERGDGHQEWCVDARAALATTVGERLGRVRRADELWAALGLPGPVGEPPSTVPPPASRPPATPATSEPSAPRKAHPDDPDAVLERVKGSMPAGESGASGDRVACERCGGAHPLEAKNTLLWYQCADGSFYLGGIDGRLLLPRAPDPE